MNVYGKEMCSHCLENLFRPQMTSREIAIMTSISITKHTRTMKRVRKGVSEWVRLEWHAENGNHTRQRLSVLCCALVLCVPGHARFSFHQLARDLYISFLSLPGDIVININTLLFV